MMNQANRPGKEEKPRIFSRTGGNQFTFDLEDIDGMYITLNRDFSGCVVIGFSKPMNESIQGSVTIEGKAVERFLWMSLPTMGGIQLFGIAVRGIVTEYDQVYTARVAGFVDTDGNTMEPQEITIKTLSKRQPVPGYETRDQVALDVAREGIVLLKMKAACSRCVPTAC